MSSFRSHEEYFTAVRALIGRLEQRGHGDAAAELRDGFGCLNGLTDGWAQFLHSIEAVEASAADRLDPDDRQALAAIRTAARTAVYRR